MLDEVGTQDLAPTTGPNTVTFGEKRLAWMPWVEVWGFIGLQFGAYSFVVFVLGENYFKVTGAVVDLWWGGVVRG